MLRIRNDLDGQALTPHLAPLFRRLSRELTREAQRELGVGAAEVNILLELWAAGPMLVGELSRRLELSGSTLTGALDRMESRGLLERETLAEDGRAIRLHAAGWTSARRAGLWRRLVAIEEGVLAGLSDKERTRLSALVAKANRNRPPP